MNFERIFLWSVGLILIGGAVLVSAQALLSQPYDGIAEAAFEAEDYEEALALWTVRAEEGDVPALVQIGRMYEQGLGVGRNPRMAADWFTLAAAQGYLEAQIQLAALYGAGPLAMRRPDLALQWYKSAAEQGDTQAQVNAAILYASGPRGVVQNPEAAAKWYQFAAEHGHPAAQLAVGLLLEDREADNPSNLQAYAWFRLSAAQGNVRARARVNQMEQSFTPPDLETAQALSREF